MSYGQDRLSFRECELSAAPAIHPDAPLIPIPGLALAAWRFTDLARQLDSHSARWNLAENAPAIVGRTGDPAAAVIIARAVHGEVGPATAIHPDPMLVP